MDRDHNGPVMVGSPEGGVDIEEVAESNPDAIYTVPVDFIEGMTDAKAREMAGYLKFEGAQADQCVEQIKKVYARSCLSHCRP